MKMCDQVDSTLLPKEEPEDDVTNLEHAELVLNLGDIKEEGEDELGSVGQFVFEPIPEYWEELDSPGPRPIVSQLETPTCENHSVIDSFPGFSGANNNIETVCTSEKTKGPHKSREPTSKIAPQIEDTESRRKAQAELTVSMPRYTSPMTSPIDVLTPINITYSRGVPPPTIVQYEEGEEEGEEKKDVIKIDEDEEKCYHYRSAGVDSKISTEQDKKYIPVTCEHNEDQDCDSINDCRRVLGDCEMPTVAELVQSQQLTYELDPIKMPVNLSFLNSDKAGSSRPQILSPAADATSAKLRKAYKERLKMVRSKATYNDDDLDEMESLIGAEKYFTVLKEGMRRDSMIKDIQSEDEPVAEVSRGGESGSSSQERVIETISDDSDENGRSNLHELYQPKDRSKDTKTYIEKFSRKYEKKVEKYEKQSRKRKCCSSSINPCTKSITTAQSISGGDNPRDIPLRFQLIPDSNRHVIVVGKNVHNWKVGKMNPPPGELHPNVHEMMIEMRKREEKLVRWFRDTERSGIPVTFTMLRNMSKGWAPHLSTDEQLHDFLARFNLHFRSNGGG